MGWGPIEYKNIDHTATATDAAGYAYPVVRDFKRPTLVKILQIGVADRTTPGLTMEVMYDDDRGINHQLKSRVTESKRDHVVFNGPLVLKIRRLMARVSYPIEDDSISVKAAYQVWKGKEWRGQK